MECPLSKDTYSKINHIQNKLDKAIYLQKFYNCKKNHQDTNDEVKNKVLISRKKINEYHNELKELDSLLKEKNLIRCDSMKKTNMKFSHHK